MPAELRPQNKRKANSMPNKVKRVKTVPNEVVEQKLKILEQKEKENPEGEERSVKGENDSEDELENVSEFQSWKILLFTMYFLGGRTNGRSGDGRRFGLRQQLLR